MSKAQQIQFNLELTDKLASFLITKPDLLDKFTGCSYVVFTKHNLELNKLNHLLVEDLLKEGNKVVKVEETEDSKEQWIFTQLNFA